MTNQKLNERTNGEEKARRPKQSKCSVLSTNPRGISKPKTIRRDLRVPSVLDHLATALLVQEQRKDAAHTITDVFSDAIDIGLLIVAYRLGPDENGRYGGGIYDGKELAYKLRELTLGLADFQFLQGMPLYPLVVPMMQETLAPKPSPLPSQTTQEVQVDAKGAATLGGLGMRRIGKRPSTEAHQSNRKEENQEE